jgi:hypothetical protein
MRCAGALARAIFARRTLAQGIAEGFALAFAMRGFAEGNAEGFAKIEAGMLIDLAI